MLGEMLASQFHHMLVTNVMKLTSDKNVSYVGQKQAGEFFRSKVFSVADTYRWDAMIERATGEPLTAKYFVTQFVK
jgi:Zn-dependent M32 family carboxypeptidase